MPPGRGLRRGENFWFRLTTAQCAQRAVFASPLSAFFLVFVLVLKESLNRFVVLVLVLVLDSEVFVLVLDLGTKFLVLVLIIQVPVLVLDK